MMQEIHRRARKNALALYRNARDETVQISDAVLSDLLTAVLLAAPPPQVERTTTATEGATKPQIAEKTF